MTYTTPSGEIHPLYRDLLAQHNVLIAGQIGTGKSVTINGMIYTALYRLPGSGPRRAQFILIDPKRVELRKYAALPHVLRYAREPEEMLPALQYGEKIMMERYHKADAAGVNEWADDGDLYIIVDEFADMMLTSKRAVEPVLQRIGQLGRAAHVHLVLATQIPSRQVITAKIKANMSCSVALHCRETIESRQVIGHKGAEELPQYGQCIYQTPSEERRRLVPMYTAEQLAERMKWWTDQAPATPARKPGLLRRLFGVAATL